MSAVQQKPATKPDATPGDEVPNHIEAAVSASQPTPANTASTDGIATESGGAASNNTTTKGEAKPGQKQGNAKDRKPRRERPPLPDPIPEKLVQRYPEPSKADLQKKIEVHDVVIRECFDKLQAAREFFDKRAKIREAGKAEFDAARKRMSAKNDELKALFERRKDYSMQIKTLRDADVNARAEAASSSAGKEADALRNLKTVQDVDGLIKVLERRQQTETMSILEEKKLIGQIAYLRHTGRDIVLGRDHAFQQEKAAKQARSEKRTELESLRKELDKQIDSEKGSLDSFKKDVDGIRAKQDAEIDKIAKETQNMDRDKVRATINDNKAAIRKIREDFSVELDQWYLNERIYAEQIKIQKRKRWEAQNAEREARRKKWEEEQAQYPEPDPYQKEKDMIAGLTVYLQTILGETVEKASTSSLLPKSGVVPSLKTKKDTRIVSTAGKQIGKGCLAEQFETLAFSDFMQKKSKGKGKKGRRASVTAPAENANADDNLKPCSIDLLAAFTHLDITPPNKFSEVRTALEAVKKKKEYYDSDPPPPEPKADMKEAPKKSAPKANGKASVKDITASGAFPGLNGAEDSQVKSADGSAAASSRPSFSEIAKGSAAAPVPAMAPNVYPTMAESNIPQDAVDAGVIGDGSVPANHDSAAPAQAVAYTES